MQWGEIDQKYSLTMLQNVLSYLPHVLRKCFLQKSNDGMALQLKIERTR